jgi:hypothetical protein
MRKNLDNKKLQFFAKFSAKKKAFENTFCAHVQTGYCYFITNRYVQLYGVIEYEVWYPVSEGFFTQLLMFIPL